MRQEVTKAIQVGRELVQAGASADGIAQFIVDFWGLGPADRDYSARLTADLLHNKTIIADAAAEFLIEEGAYQQGG